MRIDSSFTTMMLILLFVVAVAATGNLSAQAGTYEIKELGSPWPEDPLCPQQTPNSNATGINEQGDVVGVAEREYYGTDGFCHYEQHAVIWHPDDTITDLGGIPPRTAWSTGKGINDNGDGVVGFADIDCPAAPCTMATPSYWNPTDGMIGITDGNDWPTGWAWGINNAHQVALRYRNRPYYWDASEGLRVIWDPSFPAGAYGEAWEINNNGLIVGQMQAVLTGSELHAYTYDSNTDTLVDLHDPAAGPQSVAYGVNDNGDVAGLVERSNYFLTPAIWPAAGGRIDLPDSVFGPYYIYGQAEHINDLGDVVGYDSSDIVQPAIGWVAFDVLGGNTDRVALVDLLDPADAAQWEIYYGFEINDAQQITGFGLFNGETRAFLMTPAALFADGFESGDTSQWSSVVTN